MKDPVADGVTTLLVAGAALSAELDALYARFGVTSSGYEVLRVLAVDPEGRPRGAIAQRLISRAPDVTRLIDRLERQGLVKRVRSKTDRRLSVTRITPRGADLVVRVEPVLEEYRRGIAPKLSASEWKELIRLCQCIGPADEPPR